LRAPCYSGSRGLFPGAKVTDWTPAGKERPKAQYERAAEAIVGWFGERPEVDAKLTPAEAMKLTGIKDKSSFRKQVRQHPEFLHLLTQVGITDGPGGFRRIFGTTPAGSTLA
jgi:hypothetical protein